MADYERGSGPDRCHVGLVGSSYSLLDSSLPLAARKGFWLVANSATYRLLSLPLTKEGRLCILGGKQECRGR